MFSDRKPLGLKIVISLASLNAIAIIYYFLFLGQTYIKQSEIRLDYWIYGIAFLLTLLMVIGGSYGLYRRKMWGLSLFTLGSGSSLCLSSLIIMFSFKNSTFDLLFYLSVYFVFYNISANLYNWSFRHHFEGF